MSVDILGTSWDQCRSMVQYSITTTETRRLVRTDSPGRPPRLSHSSWTMSKGTSSCRPNITVMADWAFYTKYMSLLLLLPIPLLNSPWVSVRSPSTLCSSKTITICIWHTNLCHPRVNTKTFGERSFFYAGPSVWNNLPQNSATLILPPFLKPPSRRTCLIIISKLFFYNRAYPVVRRWVCACAYVSVSVCVCR